MLDWTGMAYKIGQLKIRDCAKKRKQRVLNLMSASFMTRA